MLEEVVPLVELDYRLELHSEGETAYDYQTILSMRCDRLRLVAKAGLASCPLRS